MSEQPHASIEVAGGRASIGNGLVEMQFELSAADGLRLTSLVHCATGAQWIPQRPAFDWGTDNHQPGLVTNRAGLWPDLAPPSAEFLIACSATKSDQASITAVASESSSASSTKTFTGKDASRIDAAHSKATASDDVARLDLTVDVKDVALRVTVHTEIRRGLSLVRRWATVTNTSDAPIRLHRALSLMLSLRPSAADPELYWVEAFTHPTQVQPLRRQAAVHQERLTPMTRRKILYGPYPRKHDGSEGAMAWLALRDPELDEGMFVGWEWSGVFDAEVGDFHEGAGALGVQCGISDDGDYSRQLDAGESFETPVAFFGFFRGDCEAAGRTTRAAAEAAFGLPWPEKQPPMFVGYDTWNNWQDFIGASNHLKVDRLEREIEICQKLGVELFILDFDWFPRAGDWHSDPAKFGDKSGVEAISRKVKSLGMKFGLWMGFGQAHEDSAVVRDHPEWLVCKDGKPVIGGWRLRSLCLGYAPCRDWVIEQVSRVVESFGVDWLKHDFDLIPISDAHPHAPKATDSRIETVLGYYHIMEALHRRFPSLYLDNWTPATGGADFGNFQRHHSMLTGDWYTPTALRGLNHGITHLFPTQRTHGYLRLFSKADEQSAYAWRSGLFGAGTYLLNDILQWNAETIRIARAHLDRHKQDRELFLDGGEVHRLIDHAPDYFGWEARFVYNAKLGRGVAQVFRNHDAREIHRVRFKGLDAEAAYRVRVVDAGSESPAASGAQLMDRGVDVRIAEPFASEVIEVERDH